MVYASRKNIFFKQNKNNIVNTVFIENYKSKKNDCHKQSF